MSGCRRKSSTNNCKLRGEYWPWSELPPTNPHILQAYYMWLHSRTSAAAITKSRLPTTSRCNHQQPQLYHVITHGDSSPTTTTFDCDRPRINHFLSDDSSIVEAALLMPHASHWCPLKSDTNLKANRIDPPPSQFTPTVLAQFYLHRPTEFSPPLQPRVYGPNGRPSSGLEVNYAVSRKTEGRKTFWWYDYVSVMHECTTADPFDAKKKKKMEFTSLVECGGKFYAMSLQGTLAVMQMNDIARLVITGISAIRAVPSLSWRFFEEYLVEVKGEIMLVFLIHNKSLAVVDRVEVFRLNFAKLSWIKVERLRGKTMFLKESCIWVDSAELGSRDDCVYFTHNNSWWVHDMKTCCISPALLLEN